jgi:hypothetical protein
MIERIPGGSFNHLNSVQAFFQKRSIDFVKKASKVCAAAGEDLI